MALSKEMAAQEITFEDNNLTGIICLRTYERQEDQQQEMKDKSTVIIHSILKTIIAAIYK